jgi:hypothetical protein
LTEPEDQHEASQGAEQEAAGQPVARIVRADPRSGIDENGNWTPAFVGQRPPLEVRHGAYSTLRLAPRARELADEIRNVVPAFSPADEPMVRLLALTLARVEMATRALEVIDERAEGNEVTVYLGDSAESLRRLREDSRGWINTARRIANDLGMTPTSRAKLGLDLARTETELVDLIEEGRKIRERREAEG